MAVTIPKIVSLVLAAAYVVAAGVLESWVFAATVSVGVLLPLACIWFAEPLGAWTGVLRRYHRLSPSPSWVVAAIGWGLLAGLPLMIILLSLKRG